MTTKREYINAKIYGLPKPLRDGKCTSPLKLIDTEYIYPVMIKVYCISKYNYIEAVNIKQSISKVLKLRLSLEICLN